MPREEFIGKMQQNTRNFAKRQLTWWRRDQRIVWFDRENFALAPGCEFVASC